MNPMIRKLSQALALLAIAAWGGARVGSMGGWARWERAASPLDAPEGPLPPEAIAEARAAARSAESLSFVGQAAASAMIPPGHELAAALFVQSIELDPLDATAWFRLAKERIALADLDGARAALARADALDPHYPRQRLGAIQLWGVLGEPARSVEIAKKVARLGGNFRRNAAAGLAAIGLPSRQVFSELEADALPPEEQLLVLREIASPDPEVMRSLVARIEPARFASPDLRDGFARFLGKPLLFQELFDFWSACSSTAEAINGRIAADNPGLRRTPLGAAFFLGWQEFPEASFAETRWEPAEPGSLFQDGHLQVAIMQGRPRRPIEWTFYRFAANEGAAFKIEVRVKQSPASAFRSAIRLARDGEAIASARADGEAETWQTVTLDAPALERPSLLELEIQSTVLLGAAPGEEPPRLRVGAIEFRSPPATATAPEAPRP